MASIADAYAQVVRRCCSSDGQYDLSYCKNKGPHVVVVPSALDRAWIPFPMCHQRRLYFRAEKVVATTDVERVSVA